MAISPCGHVRNKCSLLFGRWNQTASVPQSNESVPPLTLWYTHYLFSKGRPHKPRRQTQCLADRFALYSLDSVWISCIPPSKYSGKKHSADLYHQRKQPIQWFPRLETSLKTSWMPTEITKIDLSYNTAVWASTSMQLTFYSIKELQIVTTMQRVKNMSALYHPFPSRYVASLL